MITEKEYDSNRKHYTKLLGAKVTAIGFFEDEGQLWPYLTFENHDKTQFDAIIQCDPEGNGPGFLFFLEEE